MGTTDSKPYEGKHRDDSRMAARLCYFRDITVQEDERLGRPEYHPGKHRAEQVTA